VTLNQVSGVRFCVFGFFGGGRGLGLGGRCFGFGFGACEGAFGGEFHADGFGGVGGGASEAEEHGDFVLELCEFVEAEFGVAHDEDFSALFVFVEEHFDAIDFFGGGGDKGALALEHEGEDVAGVLGGGFVFFDEALEQGEGAFLAGDFGFGFGDGGGVGGAPVGDGFAFGGFFFPGVEGDVAAEVAAGFGVEVDGGDHGLAVFEGDFGLGAGVGAGADVPVLEHWGRGIEL
jgi:hypothetical protein